MPLPMACSLLRRDRMSSRAWHLFGVVSMLVAACGDEDGGAKDKAPTGLFGARIPATESTPAQPSTPKPESAPPSPDDKPEPPPPPIDPTTPATHPEVVYVVMSGKDGWTWFCTGALVSRDVVVTAAHCLQPQLFKSWEIIAPSIVKSPRVKGTGLIYDENWADVAHPDLGIVKLQTPIDLPQYAVLTDVTAKVDAGKSLSTATVVRTAEQPEAPFKKTGALPLTSTKSLGYENGYGVPMYSHGGDSGAGMFLIENGTMTHELVAVEREPDPERMLDHLSRVDADFIQWVDDQN